MNIRRACDAASLQWVRKEVDTSLEQASSALEHFLDEGHDSARIADCIDLLRQVRGTLVVIELYGAAMVAEELEAVAGMLTSTSGERLNQASEALMRGLIALPDYLAQLTMGMPDVPVGLMALLNDLRAVRDAPLFTETSLFAPGLERILDAGENDAEQPSAQLAEVVRRMRTLFHQALVRWYRVEEGGEGEVLAQLHDVIESMAQAAGTGRVARLFEAAAAVVDGVRHRAIESSVSVKLLVGRLDRALQRILRQGEEGLYNDFPVEMVKNYLYYIALAGDEVESIRNLVSRFHLVKPKAEEGDVFKGLALIGPSADTYEAVDNLLSEELTAVKDELDLAMHASQQDSVALQRLVPRIYKIADVLGIIGMGSLSHRLKSQSGELDRSLTEGASPGEEGLIALASDLIFAEMSLKSKSPFALRPSDRMSDTADVTMADDQLEPYRDEVFHELTKEFAAVKDHVSSLLGDGVHDGLAEDISRRLRIAAGAMRLLELDRVASLTERLYGCFERLAESNPAEQSLPQPQRIADGLAGIEYAIEMMALCGQDASSVLDFAENAISRIEAEFQPDTAEAEPEPESESFDAVHAQGEGIPQSEVVGPAPSPIPSPQSAVESEADDEIREIFLEEARDQQQAIEAAFAEWRHNLDDQGPLGVVRRGFHTLKGSGRMVGANVFGEFAWSIENMLNRVIEGTLQPSPAVLGCLHDAVRTVKSLVDQESAGGAVLDVDVATLEARAFELAGVPVPESVRVALEGTSAEKGGARDIEPLAEISDELESAEPLVDDIAFDYAVAEPTGSETAEAPETEISVAADDTTATEAADGKAEVPPSHEIASVEAEAPAEQLTEELPEVAADALSFEAFESIEAEASTEPPSEQRPEFAADAPSFEEFESVEFEAPAEPPTEELTEAVSDAPSFEELELVESEASAEPLAGEFPEVAAEARSVEGQESSELGASSEVLGEDRPEAAFEAPLLAEPESVEPEAFAELPAEESMQAAAATPSFEEPEFAEPEASVEPPTEALPEAAFEAPLLAEPESVEPEAFAELPAEESMQAAAATPSFEEPEFAELPPEESTQAAAATPGFEEPEFAKPEASVESPTEALPEAQAEAPAFEEPESVEPEASAEAQTVEEQEFVESEALADSQVEEMAETRESDVSDEPMHTSHVLLTEEGDDAGKALKFDIDTVLADIFRTETQSHLIEIGLTLKRVIQGGEKMEVSSDLLRAFHTLNGSAHMAGVEPIARISREVERLLRDMKTLNIPLDAVTASLLKSACTEIGVLVQSVNGPAVESPWERVTGDVQALHRAMTESPGEAQEPADDSGQALSVADPELVAIFVEEMRELFDQMENAYAIWQQGDDHGVNDLQRVLHTLKGAARLAAVTPIADLSHGFETMLSGMPKDLDEATRTRYLALGRQACDRLMEQGEKVAEQRRVPAFRNLVAQLESPETDVSESPPETLPGTEETQSPPWELPADELPPFPAAGQKARPPGERIRVSTELLDRVVDNIGEVSIYAARLAQQQATFQFNVLEMEQTVERLSEQLRKLETETEAQILYRFEREGGQTADNPDFDPLELDRFSTIQELSRALAETVDDLGNIREYLQGTARDADTLLLQQSRVVTDLQNQLMTTRLVPFVQQVSRLERLVRQTAAESGKKVRLYVEGRGTQLDRGVLDQTVPLLEHLLRNAISHGIEPPDVRSAAGKPEEGSITLTVARDGMDVIMSVEDDGSGLDTEAIRRKSVERGKLRPDQRIDDEDLLRMVLLPGFSTAKEVTQIAGRGVGLDVVNSETKQLGGTLELTSTSGKGSGFTLRLPFTLAITDVLLVQMGTDIFAIPHTSVENVVRIPRQDLSDYLTDRRPGFEYAGKAYPVRYFGTLFGEPTPLLPEQSRWFPALLIRSGGHRMAVQVDAILGNRQIVVKSVGPQLNVVPWLMGGTILGDGKVALIVDVASLVRVAGAQAEADERLPVAEQSLQKKITVMVVDDSITVRKVTARLLERHNMNVIAAKDGVEAVGLLQEVQPDLMLLDIEMPRMDGFELARHVRHNMETRRLPIIMITSRTGEKHRERAAQIGVEGYLGKPYQEEQLLDAIYDVLARVAE